MHLTRLNVMYGKLEGAEGKFARDVAGYLGIEAGIYGKWGLDVSWEHVQGTEERHRRLQTGAADISFVVGRAALEHFLKSGTTRLIGSSLNRCPYHLLVGPTVTGLKELKGKSIACRGGPAQAVPLTEVLSQSAGLTLGQDVSIRLLAGDQEAYDLLASGEVEAALLPRQYGFIAEEEGFKRITQWPDIVDDPLPVAIETTAPIFHDRKGELEAFIKAHGEAIRHLKSHRDETIRMLGVRFGHSRSLASKTFDDYLICLDDRLVVELKHLERLLDQVDPKRPGGARKLAAEWLVPGALGE